MICLSRSHRIIKSNHYIHTPLGTQGAPFPYQLLSSLFLLTAFIKLSVCRSGRVVCIELNVPLSGALQKKLACGSPS